MKILTDYDWVRLAASKDKALPVLCAVHVGERMEASDGHRAHLAPATSMAQGLWDVQTGEAVEGKFPDIDHVYYPTAPPTHEVVDPIELAAVAAAALAYEKAREYGAGTLSFVAGDGNVIHLGPRYVADILRGLPYPMADLLVHAPSSTQPVRWDLPKGRQAILMPFRKEAGASKRFDVSELVRPVVAEDEAEARTA